MRRALPRAFWRITCHVGQNPGQWPFWFREQCCAVGWAPPEFTLDGESTDRGWTGARNALKKILPGDAIVATLPDNRIGRIGTVVELQIRDDQWNPIVKPNSKHHRGANGRRILVRWDLSLGPPDMNQVVVLPASARIPPALLRKTVQPLPAEMHPTLVAAMDDESNWASIIGQFRMERALSDYIALHPDRLEGGMITHPQLSTLEHAFEDHTRADVVLEDRERRTVVVECKQGSPTTDDVKQVHDYRARLMRGEPRLGPVRAMLVHGGSSRVPSAVAKMAASSGVELVYHELSVLFVNARV